jgi:predicted RecA/RadA family phage recombinase
MKKLILAPLALIALLLGLLAPFAPATAAESAWNDGKSDSDLLWNCVTETYGTGVSANTGWWSPTGQVPKVGEPFMIRGYIGFIGTPCASQVAVLPEVLAPAGLEYIDEPVRWDIAPAGETPVFQTGGLDYFNGVNGGVAITLAGDKPFILKRGEVLEFQFPVRATREMLGSATQQPECDLRVAGDGPCPVAQSGDHFQIAFAIGGHGGSKSYVIPYVGLFAAKAAPGPIPGPATNAPSTTTAKYALKTGKRGKAVVTVSSTQVPTGELVVIDKGKVIAKAKLAAGDRGKLTITLPKMRKGTHKLVVKYLGSGQVQASASATKKITLR